MTRTRLTRNHPRPDSAVIGYDNTTSGLTAETLQEAIDELVSLIGTGVTGLDDLIDVILTDPTLADRLRFDGTDWRNSALIWRPVMVLDPDTGNYLVMTADGNAVMVEA